MAAKLFKCDGFTTFNFAALLPCRNIRRWLQTRRRRVIEAERSNDTHVGEVPILIPFEPEEFWGQIRSIIREEVARNQKENPVITNIMETPGLTEKPLFKMQEICSLFKVTKPTIYDWIKHGKLNRVKIRSRVYFLGSEIKQLMQVSILPGSSFAAFFCGYFEPVKKG